MWLVSTGLQVPELESNIRSMADVLYHEETRVSSGESVHRRGLEGGRRGDALEQNVHG